MSGNWRGGRDQYYLYLSYYFNTPIFHRGIWSPQSHNYKEREVQTLCSLVTKGTLSSTPVYPSEFRKRDQNIGDLPVGIKRQRRRNNAAREPCCPGMNTFLVRVVLRILEWLLGPESMSSSASLSELILSWDICRSWNYVCEQRWHPRQWHPATHSISRRTFQNK